MKRHLPLLMLLITIVAVYSNSFENAFHFDDIHSIVENPSIRSFHNLGRIFTDARAFSIEPANQTYRPIVTASLVLDYALAHGYNVFWFHLTTFIWFIVLVVLLDFQLVHLLDALEPAPANRWLALGVAAWFGLHPAMAETVNYAIQRADIYCALGCVAALFLFVRWPRLRRAGLYLLPFVVAILSKPTAAVFPVLLLTYFFYVEAMEESPSQRLRSSILAAIPAFVLTVFMLAVESAMTPDTFVPSTLPAMAYRCTQPLVWLRYFAALVLPLHLNVDSDLNPIAGISAGAVAGAIFVAGMMATVFWTSRRRAFYPIAFGLTWFIVTQIPTSVYILGEVENAHRMFFSFPGIMLAVVWAIYSLYKRVAAAYPRRELWLRRVLLGATLCSLCGYAYGAHLRNKVWRTEDTLWADDVAKAPHNGRGLMNYGVIKMESGDLIGANRLFEKALEYTPSYALLDTNLGVVEELLIGQGRSAGAGNPGEHFRRGVDLAPNDDRTHAYYGRWLLSQGRTDESIAELQRAVSLNMERSMSRDLLLHAYGQIGAATAAKKLAEAILHIAPEDQVALSTLRGDADLQTSTVDVHLNASLAAYRSGQFQTSIDEARKALVLDPRSVAAWNNIGAAYGAIRQWKEGIDALQRAVVLDPRLEIAQNNLNLFRTRKTVDELMILPEESAHHLLQEDNSRSAAEWIDLSEGLFQAARYADSVIASKKALALDPRSSKAWNNLAANEQALGHWDQAITAAKRALVIRPEYELARVNLARALQQRAMASGKQ